MLTFILYTHVDSDDATKVMFRRHNVHHISLVYYHDNISKVAPNKEQLNQPILPSQPHR